MIPTSRLSLPQKFPATCQWEITCRCNLKCQMCYTDCFNTPEKIRQELSTAEILHIMDQLSEEGCLELVLTGGEPLSRPDFFEIYEHAKAKGFLVTVFSNATLITEKIADRFAKLPPYRIEVSLHGITAKTFEAVTQGPGSFERCLKAIRLLKERKIPVLIKTTAMNLNKDEVLAIKQFVRDQGLSGYLLGEGIRPALNGDLSVRRFQLSDEELAALHAGDTELSADHCQLMSEPDSPCISGERSFQIDAYGSLHLCSGNRRKGYDLRNGSFKEGFYQALPTFPCPNKKQTSAIPALQSV